MSRRRTSICRRLSRSCCRAGSRCATRSTARATSCTKPTAWSTAPPRRWKTRSICSSATGRCCSSTRTASPAIAAGKKCCACSKTRWPRLPNDRLAALDLFGLLDGALESGVVSSLDAGRELVELVSALAHQLLELAPHAGRHRPAAGGPVGNSALLMVHGLGHRPLPCGSPQRLPDVGNQRGVMHAGYSRTGGVP